MCTLCTPGKGSIMTRSIVRSDAFADLEALRRDLGLLKVTVPLTRAATPRKIAIGTEG